MSSNILEQQMDLAAKEAVNPFVDRLMTQIADYLEIQKQKPGYIPTNPQREQKALSDARKFFTKWLTAEEDRKLMSDAIDFLFTEASSLPEGLDIKEELHQVDMRLADEPDLQVLTNKKTGKVYDSIQEWLGISHDIMQKIYAIGCHLFEHMQIKKASAIFVLLTNFNAFIFEPWLALGLSYKMEKNYFAALHALSMASLVDLTNLAPHLHTAEIYLNVGEKMLAKQTLEYGLSLATPEGLKQYQGMIEAIKALC